MPYTRTLREELENLLTSRLELTAHDQLELDAVIEEVMQTVWSYIETLVEDSIYE